MKAITTKELVSLAAITVTAPLFALAFVSGARVMFSTGYEVLLLTLTLSGAVVSGINGFGRRTVMTAAYSDESRKGPQSKVALTS